MRFALAAARGLARSAPLFVLVLACALAWSASAAAGRSYTVSGGTPTQQQQVRLALDASMFPWSAVPDTIAVTIARGISTSSVPGAVWLDSDLLDAGVFSWAFVQDEFAHQIDYLVLNDRDRFALNRALRGRVWCYVDLPGLPHASYGCERFSSTFVWAYWQSSANAYRPRSKRDESAAMAPAAFRALLEPMLQLRSRRTPLSTFEP